MEQTMVHGDSKLLRQAIITNILKRLPVKSLMRFQCVCKEWKNLINNLSFIADHLDHSTHHNPSLLLQRSGSDKRLPVDLCLLDFENKLHEVHNIPLDSAVRVRIVGSSNGLLCVERSNGRVHSFFWWNPAIRKIIQVHSNVYDSEGRIYVGYGFSQIVNDYKVLRVYVPKYEYRDEDRLARVEVYSLSAQGWKEIEFGSLKGVNLKSETVTADGAMFWLGSKLEREEDLVVSFDIAMETFTLIPMPPLDKSHKYSGHKLSVYEDKLAVISHFIDSVSSATDSWFIDLWLLEEGIGAPQEGWSWTRKYSLITYTGLEHPLGTFRIDPLCIWRDELVCNGSEMSGIINKTESEKNIEVSEMFGKSGWKQNINEMFGTFGESEESNGMLSVLCLLNLRTNELRKIATGRYNNEFSVIFNHVESILPIDSIRVHELQTMRQKIVDGSAQFIPQEIIRNILQRLPAKSLKKFQCVCKQWENLIMAPAFIADHLHHFNHHSPSLLFQRSGRDKGVPVELYLLDCEKQLHEVQNIPFHNRFRVRIVGSSNGFLCIEHSSSQVHSLYLWNPAIRKIRQVHSNVFSFRGSIYVGYGFSPTVNDYKILRAYVPKYEYGDKDVVNEAEVYSLRTLRWNTIKCENLKGINLKSETVTANGAMFWLGSKLDDEEDLVVSFDIAMEAFTLISMPPLDKSDKHSAHKLAVYENKLAVISYFVETVSCTTDSWSIDLWVMEEGITPQERWSWTKKYSLNTITGLEHPLGILRINPLCIWRDELVCNGDVIPGIVSKTESEGEIEVNEMFGIFGGTEPGVNILSYVSSVLCLVNIRTNEMRKIATGRFDNEFSVIFNHFESLVPVDSDCVQRYTKPNLVTST